MSARAQAAALKRWSGREPAAAPKRRAVPRALESAQGMALMQWADLEFRTGHQPMLAFLRHIPNGGARNKATAGRLKAEGVRRGTWDYVVPVVSRYDMQDDWQATGESTMRFPGLWIELKIETERSKKNGGLSDEQVEFGTHLHGQGYACVVAYDWEEARDAIMAYLSGEAVPHLWRPEGVARDSNSRRLR